MKRARTWGWAKTPRYDGTSSDLGPSSPRQSCSDCIIATRGYDFREGQEHEETRPFHESGRSRVRLHVEATPRRPSEWLPCRGSGRRDCTPGERRSSWPDGICARAAGPLCPAVQRRLRSEQAQTRDRDTRRNDRRADACPRGRRRELIGRDSRGGARHLWKGAVRSSKRRSARLKVTLGRTEVPTSPVDVPPSGAHRSSAIVKGFGRRPRRDISTCAGGRRPKASKGRNRGEGHVLGGAARSAMGIWPWAGHSCSKVW